MDPRRNASGLEGLRTESGLTFAMQGSLDILNTTKKIARVPLSDYVTTEERRDSVVATTLKSINSINSIAQSLSSETSNDDFHLKLHKLCASLVTWQEGQQFLLPIDDRFRFRCLLFWLASDTPAQPRRIVSEAATFLVEHANNYFEVLLAEDRSLKQIRSDEHELESPMPTEEELKARAKVLQGLIDRLEVLSNGMQDAGGAIKQVLELVGLITAGGLVEGELEPVKDGSSESSVESRVESELDLAQRNAALNSGLEIEENPGSISDEEEANGEEGQQDAEMEDVYVDDEWQVDDSFGSF